MTGVTLCRQPGIQIGMKSAAASIRVAREASGLTQAEVARGAGTSQPAMSRYERGTAIPSKHTLDRILAACSKRKPRPRDVLLANRDKVLELLRSYGATKVLVFGSVAGGRTT